MPLVDDPDEVIVSASKCHWSAASAGPWTYWGQLLTISGHFFGAADHLHALPPPRTGRSGRPRTRGARLGTPADLAAAATAGARWRTTRLQPRPLPRGSSPSRQAASIGIPHDTGVDSTGQ